MPNLGGPEIIVILLVALIVLGPSRLPEVGRQIGGAIRELRKVQTDVKAQIDEALRPDDPPVAPSVISSNAPAIEPMDAASAAGEIVSHEVTTPPGTTPPPPVDSFD